jgi:hypothetical protein
MRELALELDMTERHVARILRELSTAELITVRKRGNRNIYTVNEEASCGHPSIPPVRLGNLVDAVRREGKVLKRTYHDVSTKLAALALTPFSFGETESLALLVPVLT